MCVPHAAVANFNDDADIVEEYEAERRRQQPSDDRAYLKIEKLIYLEILSLGL